MNILDEATANWFAEKASNPDFTRNKFLPALESTYHKAHNALHEANRKGTLEEIKYRMGWLDGVHEILGLTKGLRLAESRPAEPGLRARIFDAAKKLTGYSPLDAGL